MIDDSTEPGRIDLRALDEPADQAQADRVIRAALARAAAGRGRPPRAAPLFATAAVLLLAAGLLLFAPRRASYDEAAGLVAAWTVSSHVPTNAELLAAFGGYGR